MFSLIQNYISLANCFTYHICNLPFTEYTSIDNGAQEDYFEGYTRISYQADTGFVSGGVNNVTPSATSFAGLYFERQLKSLRSFPDGKRNCYSLKTKGDNSYKYHITALFGGADKKPTFDLYIGANYWDTISWDRDNNVLIYVSDAIFFATSDIIDVCLVKTNDEIPFISLLELRPLKDSIYGTTASYPTPMALKTRKNIGMLEHNGDYVR